MLKKEKEPKLIIKMIVTFTGFCGLSCLIYAATMSSISMSAENWVVWVGAGVTLILGRVAAGKLQEIFPNGVMNTKEKPKNVKSD
jgi:hypothetical protein